MTTPRRAPHSALGRPSPPRSRARRALLILTLLCSFGCRPATDSPPPATGSSESVADSHVAGVDAPGPGIVIESVSDGQPGDRAGALPGDLLSRWELRATAEGEVLELGSLDTPWDLDLVTSQYGPRGLLTLSGARDRSSITLTTERAGNWRLRSRPAWPDDVVREYEKLRELRRREPQQSAEGLVALAQVTIDPLDAAFLQARAADSWGALRADGGSTDRWRDALAEARRLAGEAGADSIVGELLQYEGMELYRRGRLDEAEELLEQALQVRRRTGASILEASLHIPLGGLARRRGRIDAALQHHRQAVSIYETEAPDSLALARAWNNLARTLTVAGQDGPAERLLEQSLELRERLLPDSVDLAGSLNSLGVHHARRGELAEAQALFERELELRRQYSAGSRSHALVVANLAAIASDRGDLYRAERLYRESLELQRRGPGGLSVRAAPTLTNLANVALKLGDYAVAESRLLEAVELEKASAPASLGHANALELLSNAVRMTGNLERSVQLARQSLDIREAAAPGNWQNAWARIKVGVYALESGNITEAQRQLDQAWPQLRESAPRSLASGEALSLRGDIELAEGRFERALESFRRALDIYRRAAPGSYWVTDAQHGVARSLDRLGDVAAALEAYEGGLQALEAQDLKIGSAFDRASFSARFEGLLEEYLRLLLDRDESEQAFLLLERARSRQLRRQLGSRDLVLAGLPENLDRERRRLGQEYTRRLRRLLDSPADAEVERVESALRGLRETERQRELLRAELARRLGDQRVVPVAPLGAPEAARALDPGSALLSFYIGDQNSWLFGLETGGEVAVWAIPLTRAELTDAVARFRRLVATSSATRDPVDELAAELYQQLLAPARELLQRAERLIVVPHGPLRQLPFAALTLPAADGQPGPDYLIERWPISYAFSVSSWRQTRSAAERDRGEARPSIDFAALGDPATPNDGSPVASALSSGGQASPTTGGIATDHRDRFPPLPWSRSEVERAGALFGRSTTVSIGNEATEQRAREALSRARVAHFAVHGFNDSRLPMDGGLVFSPSAPHDDSAPAEGGAGRDGLLQAWEILEMGAVQAELVTLSSCESGRGRELGLEAPFGLSRALQLAGVRSVLVSSWSISDRSTALLMERFYRELLAGKTKDEALRQAQLQLLRAPVEAPVPISWWQRLAVWRARQTTEIDATHPYHWAAFRLEGDWR